VGHELTEIGPIPIRGEDLNSVSLMSHRLIVRKTMMTIADSQSGGGEYPAITKMKGLSSPSAEISTIPNQQQR